MATLSSSRIRTLLRKRSRLLQECATLAQVIRGSYVERYSTCSRPRCRCHQGERHGPRAYVALTRAKRQRQVYVPRAQAQAARRGVQQYRRLLELVDAISEINLELMQGGVLDESVE